jgi:hypothetical protein
LPILKENLVSTAKSRISVALFISATSRTEISELGRDEFGKVSSLIKEDNWEELFTETWDSTRSSLKNKTPVTTKMHATTAINFTLLLNRVLINEVYLFL